MDTFGPLFGFLRVSIKMDPLRVNGKSLDCLEKTGQGLKQFLCNDLLGYFDVIKNLFLMLAII